MNVIILLSICDQYICLRQSLATLFYIIFFIFRILMMILSWRMRKFSVLSHHAMSNKIMVSYRGSQLLKLCRLTKYALLSLFHMWNELITYWKKRLIMYSSLVWKRSRIGDVKAFGKFSKGQCLNIFVVA